MRPAAISCLGPSFYFIVVFHSAVPYECSRSFVEKSVELRRTISEDNMICSSDVLIKCYGSLYTIQT